MNLMDLAARLTLDMRDYEEGLDKAKQSAESFSGKFGGAIKKVGGAIGTVAKVGAAGIAAGSAAVGVLTKQAVDGYSQYEQLSGGVRKLFGDAYDDVMKYASESYKTAGVSANQYMEQATSFSAALIGSLGGDTKKAADYADMAMRSMSDNANTFGTDIAAIQNAYQGFSKQNYTMLDNLKLGYGGTKTEMQRLVEDAEALNTGFKAQRNEAGELTLAFSDVVQAIELIQQKQNIAGTTAKEAATTIEGAMNMTKAAWENLVAGFANPDADMDKLMDNLIIAIVGDKKGEGLLNQIIPAVERALDGIGKFIEKAAPVIAQYLPGLMEKILPRLIRAATSLMTGLISALPTIIRTLIKQIPYVVTQIKDALIKAAPMIVEGGKELAKSIYDGIIEAFPQLEGALTTLKDIFDRAFNAISGAVNFVIENIDRFMPVLAAVGGALAALGIVGIISSIAGAITTVVGAIGGLITALSMIKSFAGLVSVITTLAGGPLVLIPVLIGAIVGAIIYLWNTSEEFRNFVIGLWETVKGIFMAAAEAVAGFVLGIDKAFTSLIKTVLAVFDKIKKKAGEFKDAVIQKITDLKNGFIQKVTDLKNGATQKFQEIREGITNKIENAKSSILSKATAMKDGFVQKVQAIKDEAVQRFTALRDGIAEKIQSIRDGAVEKFETLRENIGQKIDDIKNGALDKFQALRDGFGEKIDSILEKARDVFEGVKGFIEDPLSAARDFVSNAIEDIKGFFDFEISFPSIKLPHFSIDWEDAGGWFSIPHVSIDWYAKAYDNPWLFTEPTVLGGRGFGDRPGGEIVYGHENLMRDIEGAVGSPNIVSALQGIEDAILDSAVNLDPVIDALTASKNQKFTLNFEDAGGTKEMGLDEIYGSMVMHLQEIHSTVNSIDLILSGKKSGRKQEAFAPVFNIYTQEGQSNREIADYVMERLQREYAREGRAFA